MILVVTFEHMKAVAEVVGESSKTLAELKEALPNLGEGIYSVQREMVQRGFLKLDNGLYTQPSPGFRVTDF